MCILCVCFVCALSLHVDVYLLRLLFDYIICDTICIDLNTNKIMFCYKRSAFSSIVFSSLYRVMIIL